MSFSAKDLKAFLQRVVETVEENKDYLSELDRKLGDGDHGVTMSIGWQAVQGKLNNELKDENDCGKISISAGRTFLSAVGSTVGPLYATGFLRGGKELQGKNELTGQDLYNFWTAFIEGVKERGQAEVGDKTMIDTLQPALETLKQEYARSGSFAEAFSKAVASSKEGMESTKDLISKKGRSSRLGERSLGNQDPGATSSHLILKAFESVMTSVQTA